MQQMFTAYFKSRSGVSTRQSTGLVSVLIVVAMSSAILFTSTSVQAQANQAQKNNEAMDLLNRMRLALHQLDYTGTLVYRREDSLSTLHIEHSVVNGVERERVVRLNEQGSEISRELKGFSLASIPVIRPQMEKVYSFDLGRENRVANIPCRIITARPKDRVRYLQKYCIDTKSGLLLDYMLVGKTHKPVEQFMFTSIQFSQPKSESGEAALGAQKRHSRHAMSNSASSAMADAIMESLPLDVEMELKSSAPDLLGELPIPTVKMVKAKVTTINVRAKSSVQVLSNELDDGWVMEPLPIGFEITQAPPVKATSHNDVPTKHYVVSDGLSSLSVFVSPLASTPLSKDSAVFKEKQGVQLNSGALNIISRKKDNYLITVVGEVPESTLKSVVDSMRRTKQP